MNKKKVIVAVSTPQGIGALALIRLTGEGSFKVFKKCIEERKLFEDEKERKIRRYTFIDDRKKTIDDITAIKYEKPNTFTGEEMIEIICHGGKFVVKKIIKTICENGAILAEKGEFTKRAYLNGKMNLLKAESINSIILSENEMDHKTAIQFYRQKNESILQEIEEQIKQEITKIEADIEFGEDEQNEIEDEDNTIIKKIIKKLENELYIRKKVECTKNEHIVTIVGPTNAGKSSLYNEILGYERAIVSDIDGTTRDSISEIIEIQGIKCKLIDTAGIRITNDEIEKEGQKNTQKTIKKAEIVIWITDISKKLNRIEKEEFEKHKSHTSIIIANKTDKKKNKEKEEYYKKHKQEIIPISIKEQKNIKKLISWLDRKIMKFQYKELEPSLILNERHKTTVKEVNRYLKKAIKDWEQKEMAAEYLYYALREIEKINGKRNQEDIINSIFDKFCIGK